MVMVRRMKIKLEVLAVLAVWICSVGAPARADSSALALALEAQVNALEPEGSELRGLSIAWPELIQRFYTQRGFQPVWDRPAAVHGLLRSLRASYDDGLEPEDYYFTALGALAREVAAGGVGETALAEFEVLCTEALLRLGYHLVFGKVDASVFDPHWNYGRTLAAAPSIIAKVEQVVGDADLFGRLEALKPTHYLYQDLKRELARYRDIAAKGGWRPIPAGPPLKLGAVDARVALLRARLGASGELGAPASDPNLLDDALAAAVRETQSRLGLLATGVIDAKTLAALNLPVSARIEQIRVNLDRGRVLLQDLPEDFVVVNVPGFEAYLVRNNAVAWSARVQVGRPVRRTPIFRSTLSYVVFNPTWTVPPVILARDILPEARKSAKAISRRGLKVYDRAGRELDPAKIRWKTLRAGNVPYVLRQDAGPGNALGRVKLIFPNSYAVYLHDTPAQELFEAGDRSFSSGCVRVERALELARLVLNDPAKWGAAQIEEVVNSQRTLNVGLTQGLPVLLAYWTAWVDRERRLNFRADVYQHDPLWSKQLAAGFVARKRPLASLEAPHE
jgi:murein L,D-transpeptidase YcbB/YkuD